MAIKQLNPYLNFGGNAAQAIAFYEKALGAKTETSQTFGDVPGMPAAAENKDRIMHALLKLGAGTIMISDGPPGLPIPTDSNVHVTLDFEDAGEMQQRFDALSAGGTVTMPLQDTFWGARFDMLKDQFNISWMFNCQK